MELTIPLETVCRIILRAREFETLIPESDPDEGSNPTDDGAVDELEDEDNPTEEELRAIVDDLADDEQAELIALAMVGAGALRRQRMGRRAGCGDRGSRGCGGLDSRSADA